MPLDHFVSQVHLKRFNSPGLGNRLYAIRKADLKAFTPRPEDICRIEDGSTNAYLREDRIVERFLNSIEPKYNRAVDKLSDGHIDWEIVYTVAGFVAYVLSVAPASMRIHGSGLQEMVKKRAITLDSKGLLPPPPSKLEGLNLSKILEQGLATVDIDPKFPQAIGIANIHHYIGRFGNSRWEVLHNKFDDTPYFTSDYPVAIELGDDATAMNRIVPLSPSLAIRIRPDRAIPKEEADFQFRHFSYESRRLTRRQVAHINRLLVRCAEEVVCFRDNYAWVASFVKKHSPYRIEMRKPQTVSDKPERIMWEKIVRVSA